MAQNSSGNVELKIGRIFFCYLVCAVAAVVAPLESYLESGEVGRNTVIASSLGFVVGVIAVSLAVSFYRKGGSLLHYRARTK